VALYYYLVVLKQALVAEAPGNPGPIRVPWPAASALVAAAVLIVVLGLFPGLLLGMF